MFILVKLNDTVVIKPKFFGSDQKEVLEQELNSRFANKIIYKVGLCISLWDILNIGDSFISDVDGAHHVKVSFRFACFRPSLDEVVLGTVKSMNKAGIRVTLNFFDDVYIPADKLRHPSRYDYDQDAWIWEYAFEGETAELRIDKNDTIRFRVVDEIWRDPNPDTRNPHGASGDQDTPTMDGLTGIASAHSTPYTIVGSIVSDGLGVTCWWVN